MAVSVEHSAALKVEVIRMTDEAFETVTLNSLKVIKGMKLNGNAETQH